MLTLAATRRWLSMQDILWTFIMLKEGTYGLLALQTGNCIPLARPSLAWTRELFSAQRQVSAAGAAQQGMCYVKKIHLGPIPSGHPRTMLFRGLVWARSYISCAAALVQRSKCHICSGHVLGRVIVMQLRSD